MQNANTNKKFQHFVLHERTLLCVHPCDILAHNNLESLLTLSVKDFVHFTNSATPAQRNLTVQFIQKCARDRELTFTMNMNIEFDISLIFFLYLCSRSHSFSMENCQLFSMI